MKVAAMLGPPGKEVEHLPSVVQLLNIDWVFGCVDEAKCMEVVGGARWGATGMGSYRDAGNFPM